MSSKFFRNAQTVHLGRYGTADDFNEAPPTSTSITHWLRRGELGQIYEGGAGEYQMVQLDSGATSATPVGVVAANQLAFWKDKSTYLVTNDDRFSEGGSVTNAYTNFVAGVFRNAATAGNYTLVLQKATNVYVKAKSSAGGIGKQVTAEASAPHTATVDTPQAIGTFAGYQVIGVSRAAGLSSSRLLVDLDIPPAE